MDDQRRDTPYSSVVCGVWCVRCAVCGVRCVLRAASIRVVVGV